MVWLKSDHIKRPLLYNAKSGNWQTIFIFISYHSCIASDGSSEKLFGRDEDRAGHEEGDRPFVEELEGPVVHRHRVQVQERVGGLRNHVHDIRHLQTF